MYKRQRRANLVKGTRGPGGGYRLAKEMDQISVAAIITAVDEKVDVTRCGGKTDCQDGERCLTHELWSSLSGKIYEFLDDISLGNLVREPGVQQVAERQDSRRQGKEDNVSRKVAFIHDELTPI